VKKFKKFIKTLSRTFVSLASLRYCKISALDTAAVLLIATIMVNSDEYRVRSVCVW